MAALEQGGATISGLHGMGGIGKTALALNLAEQLTAHYPDAQFYLDLKGTSSKPLSVAEAMAHVIRAYHPTDKLPESEAELSGLYQSVLHRKHALLLMDNVADKEQVAPLIPPPSCILLVTSRQHFTLPGLFPQRLDALLPDDACALLLKIAPRIREHADALAQLCGYLPLALRVAASTLAERINLTPADYLRRLTDTKQRLKLTGVDASLRLSFEFLSAELQQRWCALAVFPDTFDRLAAAAVWELNSDPAQDILGTVMGYSLVEWNPNTTRYRLHDIVRIFAHTYLSWVERAASRRRHAVHYETVLRTARELYKQGGEALKRGLSLFDVEWANIQAGQEWAELHAGEDNATAALCTDYPRAGVYLLDLRQHPRERIRWLEAALTAARGLKRSSVEGAHLGNLGTAYYLLGESRRAIEFYEQHLTIARKIGDRRGEGNALNNLGLAHVDLREPRRAIEFYEQQLVITREVGDRRGEGFGLSNMGLAYMDLGEPRHAIELYERGLLILREIGDRRGEANSLDNLGNAYFYFVRPKYLRQIM